MDNIIGVTFPIRKALMNRFFEEKRTVFVKPATVWTRLRKGMKFIFYQSIEDTGYIGEAKIKTIVFSDDPRSFFDTFNDQIFLSRDELSQYIDSQSTWKIPSKNEMHKKKRLWMAIELENLRKYDSIKKPKQFVSVGGRYIKSTDYQGII